MIKEFEELISNKRHALENRRAHIEQEKIKIQKQLSDIETEQANLESKFLRFDKLPFISVSAPYCVVCFIDHSEVTLLMSVSSDDDEDAFECKRCGISIRIPA